MECGVLCDIYVVYVPILNKFLSYDLFLNFIAFEVRDFQCCLFDHLYK